MFKFRTGPGRSIQFGIVKSFAYIKKGIAGISNVGDMMTMFTVFTTVFRNHILSLRFI